MIKPPGNVLTCLCNSARRLLMVAPYIKADALSRVLDNLNPATTLTCITRWNVNDIAVGASDVQCRSIVKEFGGSFLLHPTLHAKYYRVDDAILIGSVNLTNAAMGWSPEPNLEILTQAGADFDPSVFESVLMNESREVSDDEFERWLATVNLLPERGTFGDARGIGSWRPATRDPQNLILIYQGRDNDIASSDERRAGRRDVEILQIPQGMSEEQVQNLASVCLLETSFANSVLRMQNVQPSIAIRSLSEMYGLSLIDARRDMEAVLNWIAFLVPGALHDPV